MGMFQLSALFLVWQCTVLNAYPSGAPDMICASMVPQHDPPTNTGFPPFTLHVSDMHYGPSSNITVTLTKNATSQFKGFLLQARRVAGDQDTLIGNFTVDSTNKTKLACTSIGPNAAVTHVDNSEKDNITVTWTAPDVTQGDLIFRATVVEVFTPGNVSRYWLNITSQVIAGATPNVTTVSPTFSPDLAPIDVTGCGNSKGCYRFPAKCTGSEDCDYLLAWQVQGNMVEFEISALVSDVNSWTAVAFSTNQKMGNDSVNECIYDSKLSSTLVQASWNDMSPTNTALQNPYLGLDRNKSEAGVADGRIQCKFSRQILVTGLSSAGDDASKIYNLTSAYYLFLGRGPALSGVLQPHTEHPKISPVMINVSDSSSYVDIGGSAKSTLVIYHGSFMLVAWLFLANIGVLMPRHFRRSWINTNILGKEVWFQMHRMMMVLALSLTSAAFSLIFIDVGGFAHGLKGTSFFHQILGIVVTALAFLNLFMGILRPKPHSPNRMIFNLVHKIVGRTTHVSALVTVTFGTRMERASLSTTALWVTVGAIGWHFLVEFILFLHSRFTQNSDMYAPEAIRSSDDYSSENMSGISSTRGLIPTETNQLATLLKSMILGAHVLVLSACTAFVIYDLVQQ